MKVAVLGAGVVGVATAYYLARDGHEVVLIERRAKAAEEASFGNGGLVSPSDAYAWASPDALKMALKSLYRSDLGIKYRLRLDPRLWVWSVQFLTQCTSAAAYRNTLVKLRLISYSKDCLNRLVEETGIGYDGRSQGILYYFRSKDGLKAASHHMGILRDQGLRIETVERDRMLELEPVMERAPEVAGGIYSPDCQTGDSHKFSNNLAEWCRTHKGTTLFYDAPIRRLIVEGDRVVRVQTDRGEVAADAFVLAAGSESALIAGEIGVRLPIYPVKGFSITAPLTRPEAGPHMGLVDEDLLVAMSPFGGRLRAAASAVFAGYDYGHRPKDFRSIHAITETLYGDAVDQSRIVYWTGLRPMTPSSVPILGPSRYGNLFLNVGHGHVGWSMACGSGRFVADQIAGRQPEIDTDGLLAV
ncbi:MAG: D-amino acid dehydrogenase [Rhodobacteraceae bacterium]|uniref:D-amino acid dehydrogenase n=1 Tax=Amaricoccus sp. TaxID=1872485 RepID=UPI001D2B25CC|nr:D-amino acid dehydrogenase [Amaricoccus sp.]MCB1369909.1 D-amino acid dehydrogenase [Paracoccaceae bacterium]MCC0067765.1 D-amino acid dehydrogenase [Rhodovulum sp.]MCB1373011.1 D-amino acid dehydrogenase [Paracoccaceae bacterium]MCB1403201.1 D-amino acid dehydrogenase [Paracoccaceae bacterium]HRW15056.1 D-amino acid dehydrogenase [Amaricoccus sp.]